ncbi:MAG: hypothetical protein ACP5XB_04885 [Isosphaeraceae bacterium]
MDRRTLLPQSSGGLCAALTEPILTPAGETPLKPSASRERLAKESPPRA